jgi:spore germination protein GerM
MRRPSRHWLVAVLVTAMVALASCGIPKDSRPREISREALPPELIDPASTDTSLPADTATRNFTLYFVRSDDRDGEALVSVRLKVPMPPDDGQIPLAVAQALIDASPESLGFDDLVNRLPGAAQVRSAVVDGNNVLDLDLTNLGHVRSALERLAVAQLVFTLTELSVPQIDAVRFSVDGTEVSVPIEGGVASAGAPVDRTDEPSLEHGPYVATTTTTTTGG